MKKKDEEISKKVRERFGEFKVEMLHQFALVDQRFALVDQQFLRNDKQHERINEQLEEIKNLIDEMMGQVRAMRDEQTIQSSQHKRLLDLEEIHPGGKHVFA